MIMETKKDEFSRNQAVEYVWHADPHRHMSTKRAGLMLRYLLEQGKTEGPVSFTCADGTAETLNNEETMSQLMDSIAMNQTFEKWAKEKTMIEVPLEDHMVLRFAVHGMHADTSCFAPADVQLEDLLRQLHPVKLKQAVRDLFHCDEMTWTDFGSFQDASLFALCNGLELHVLRIDSAMTDDLGVLGEQKERRLAYGRLLNQGLGLVLPKANSWTMLEATAGSKRCTVAVNAYAHQVGFYGMRDTVIHGMMKIYFENRKWFAERLQGRHWKYKTEREEKDSRSVFMETIPESLRSSVGSDYDTLQAFLQDPDHQLFLRHFSKEPDSHVLNRIVCGRTVSEYVRLHAMGTEAFLAGREMIDHMEIRESGSTIWISASIRDNVCVWPLALYLAIASTKQLEEYPGYKLAAELEFKQESGAAGTASRVAHLLSRLFPDSFDRVLIHVPYGKDRAIYCPDGLNLVTEPAENMNMEHLSREQLLSILQKEYGVHGFDLEQPFYIGAGHANEFRKWLKENGKQIASGVRNQEFFHAGLVSQAAFCMGLDTLRLEGKPKVSKDHATVPLVFYAGKDHFPFSALITMSGISEYIAAEYHLPVSMNIRCGVDEPDMDGWAWQLSSFLLRRRNVSEVYCTDGESCSCRAFVDHDQIRLQNTDSILNPDGSLCAVHLNSGAVSSLLEELPVQIQELGETIDTIALSDAKGRTVYQNNEVLREPGRHMEDVEAFTIDTDNDRLEVYAEGNRVLIEPCRNGDGSLLSALHSCIGKLQLQLRLQAVRTKEADCSSPLPEGG